MSARHTPGPWQVNPLQLSEVASVAGPLLVMVAFATGDKPHEEVAANARLIAAAPELLAACQAVESAQRAGTYAEAFEAVRAAIAKAGEAA